MAFKKYKGTDRKRIKEQMIKNKCYIYYCRFCMYTIRMWKNILWRNIYKPYKLDNVAVSTFLIAIIYNPIEHLFNIQI